MGISYNRIWLITITLTIIVPIVAGTLGCLNRIGGLSSDNITWILFCSAMPVIIFAVINLGIVSLAVYHRRTEKQIIGVLIITSIPAFLFSFYFVDSASGI
ncbi:MAG: NADH:ubiquinone oxidoreductase subunit K [Crocinitomicaceae bacterium]|jgi:NADH:ubiquinone oxidoreductase subunit K